MWSGLNAGWQTAMETAAPVSAWGRPARFFRKRWHLNFKDETPHKQRHRAPDEAGPVARGRDQNLWPPAGLAYSGKGGSNSTYLIGLKCGLKCVVTRVKLLE